MRRYCPVTGSLSSGANAAAGHRASVGPCGERQLNASPSTRDTPGGTPSSSADTFCGDVLGYFIGREEEEIIVDPTLVTERSEEPPLVPRTAIRTAASSVVRLKK